jgi:hypothetical protein
MWPSIDECPESGVLVGTERVWIPLMTNTRDASDQINVEFERKGCVHVLLRGRQGSFLIQVDGGARVIASDQHLRFLDVKVEADGWCAANRYVKVNMRNGNIFVTPMQDCPQEYLNQRLSA